VIETLLNYSCHLINFSSQYEIQDFFMQGYNNVMGAITLRDKIIGGLTTFPSTPHSERDCLMSLRQLKVTSCSRIGITEGEKPVRDFKTISGF
jgi:hypothetical protein